jgi:hypothetical protein
VFTPALVAHDVQRRSLTLTAVPGESLGPKYPLDLSPTRVDAVMDLAVRLRAYDAERRRLRRPSA